MLQSAPNITAAHAAITAIPEGIWLDDALQRDAADLGGDLLSVEALSLVAMLQRRFAPTGHGLFGAATLEEGFPAEGQAVRQANWNLSTAPGGDGHIAVQGCVDKDLALASHKARQRRAVEAIASSRPVPALQLCGWQDIALGIEVDARPVVAALYHVGLHLQLHGDAAAMTGTLPGFVLVDIQTPAQARLWNDILWAAGEALDLPAGAIGITLAIEGQNAAFRAEELVFELKDHLRAVVSSNEQYLPVLAALGRKRQVPVLAGGNVTAERLAVINATVSGDEKETILAAFAAAEQPE